MAAFSEVRGHVGVNWVRVCERYELKPIKEISAMIESTFSNPFEIQRCVIGPILNSSTLEEKLGEKCAKIFISYTELWGRLLEIWYIFIEAFDSNENETKTDEIDDEDEHLDKPSTSSTDSVEESKSECDEEEDEEESDGKEKDTDLDDEKEQEDEKEYDIKTTEGFIFFANRAHTVLVETCSAISGVYDSTNFKRTKEKGTIPTYHSFGLISSNDVGETQMMRHVLQNLAYALASSIDTTTQTATVPIYLMRGLPLTDQKDMIYAMREMSKSKSSLDVYFDGVLKIVARDNPTTSKMDKPPASTRIRSRKTSITPMRSTPTCVESCMLF